jgi:hypothetical protein
MGLQKKLCDVGTSHIMFLWVLLRWRGTVVLHLCDALLVQLRKNVGGSHIPFNPSGGLHIKFSNQNVAHILHTAR